MKQFFSLVGALALGVTAMYYFDPQQGRRRRALVEDKVSHMSHDTRDYLEGRRKRAADRVRGLVAQVRARLSSEPFSDQQLLGHVRSRLGRAVSYPHAVETQVQQGRVLLKGDILEEEFNPLMAEVWSIRGVRAIDSQLALHAEPGEVSSLQGRPRRTSRARVRYFARNVATVLAIAGGLGAVFKARHAEGSAAGMLSLAVALLGYGMGDGAQRLSRRRRGRILAPRVRERPETAVEHGSERAAEGTPALLNPAIH